MASRQRKQEQEDASSEIIEVAPNVLRLQLPIRFTGLGHVNCYALEDADGFALMDPGMPGRKSYKALGSRLDAAGIPLSKVHSVIVTHSHPDHFGGAKWLQEKSGGAEIITSSSFRSWWDPASKDEDTDAEGPLASRGRELGPVDMETARSPFGPAPWRSASSASVSARLQRVAFRMMARQAKRWMHTPTPTKRLEDAEVIKLARSEWVAVHTPGHTPDHLCLFNPADGSLFSGDHVLPQITPHVGGPAAGSPSGGDVLADYIESLRRMDALEGASNVLPAHGHPFADLMRRVDEILAHHDHRLEMLRMNAQELGGEASVQQLTRRMFKPRQWGMMAESEVYAHLEHLRITGRAACREEGNALLYRVE